MHKRRSPWSRSRMATWPAAASDRPGSLQTLDRFLDGVACIGGDTGLAGAHRSDTPATHITAAAGSSEAAEAAVR
jgi:hypothetical protein